MNAMFHDLTAEEEERRVADRSICETCKSFVPSGHKLFDGTCHNMRATLGAVLQTSRTSTCHRHEFRSLTADGEIAEPTK